MQLGQSLAPGQVDSDDADKLAQGFGRFHTMVAVQNPVVPGDENGLLASVGPVVGNPPGFRLVDLLLGLLQLVRGDELQLARRDVVALFCVTGADLGHLGAWNFAEFCLGVFVHFVEEELLAGLLGELLFLCFFLGLALLLGLVVHLAQGVRVGDAGRCSQLGCGCLVFDEVIEGKKSHGRKYNFRMSGRQYSAHPFKDNGHSYTRSSIVLLKYCPPGRYIHLRKEILIMKSKRTPTIEEVDKKLQEIAYGPAKHPWPRSAKITVWVLGVLLLLAIAYILCDQSLYDPEGMRAMRIEY